MMSVDDQAETAQRITYWPQPTPEYVQAIAGLSKGTPWSSADPSLIQTLYGGFHLAGQIYTYLEPDRRSNDANEPFAVEMHFVRGDLLPNAFAFHNGATYCIGITLTLFILFERVAYLLLKEETLNEILYEEDIAKVHALQCSLDDSDLDLSGMSYIGFEGADIHDEVLARHDEYVDLIYLQGEKPSERARFDAELLRDLALEYVLHHEIGHIVHGHVGLVRSEMGAAAISEAMEPGAGDAWTRRRWRMEFEADIFASKVFFRTSGSHLILSRRTPFQKTHGQMAVLQFLALTVVQAAFAIVGALRGFDHRSGDWNRFAIDMMTKDGRYPSASIRLICAWHQHQARLERACGNGTEGYRKEVLDEFIAKSETLRRWLRNHYGEFALMGLGVANKADAIMDAYSQALEEGESLTEACRPFAFL